MLCFSALFVAFGADVSPATMLPSLAPGVPAVVEVGIRAALDAHTFDMGLFSGPAFELTGRMERWSLGLDVQTSPNILSGVSVWAGYHLVRTENVVLMPHVRVGTHLGAGFSTAFRQDGWVASLSVAPTVNWVAAVRPSWSKVMTAPGFLPEWSIGREFDELTARVGMVGDRPAASVHAIRDGFGGEVLVAWRPDRPFLVSVALNVRF